MRAIIIDDDNINTSLLTHLIQQYCKDVAILASADSVEEGLILINKHQPTLLFLDIEIHNKNARDILQLIDTEAIRVILITAYENYAVEMIQYNISGYLLKPIEITKLVGAIKKVKTEIERRKQLQPTSLPTAQYISIEKKDYVILIPMQEIVRIESNGRSADIYTMDAKKHFSTKTIAELEALLPPENFIRVHASHVVNIHFVAKYLKTRNGSIVMKDETEIPIALTYKFVAKEKFLN
jgi:two-component system, LytTR family, response regulator